ncbi:MAG: Rrf2 family transcriptional regulator [Christensenella sp.]|uniref:RrF2 family transcriptional regulator n=1 Tax=Christensenella sp. TaxID=1935934 RepID=UPI002B20B0EB|nr:Rrf2 family transcriptional regulator [Christensenella sp.]MEA5003887.1 Rrf2 family transcriptional regulator [Christensenella sp.]
MKTDYGLRILISMQKENNKAVRGSIQKIITAGDLSETLKISYLYLMKFMKDLRRAGIVYSIQGSKGGFALCKAGENITVYDVVRAVEGNVEIFPCCHRNSTAKCMEECPYDEAGQCGIYIMLRAMEEDITRKMKTTTIADLCRMEEKGSEDKNMDTMPFEVIDFRTANL